MCVFSIISLILHIYLTVLRQHVSSALSLFHEWPLLSCLYILMAIPLAEVLGAHVFKELQDHEQSSEGKWIMDQ